MNNSQMCQHPKHKELNKRAGHRNSPYRNRGDELGHSVEM